MTATCRAAHRSSYRPGICIDRTGSGPSRPHEGPSETREIARGAYMPFSAGPRICPGAGFATIEAQVMLAVLTHGWALSLPDGPAPVPVAHLTVRSAEGIHVRLARRRNEQFRNVSG